MRVTQLRNGASRKTMAHSHATRNFLAAAAAISLVFDPALTHALTTEEILNYTGPDRQKVLEAGARKEGSVVIYSGMIVNQLLRPLTAAFEKKYPYLKATYWRGDGNQIVVKVLAELRANALAADIVEGSGMSAGAAQMVVPFSSPLFVELRGEHIAADRTWAATRLRYIGLGYNTKFVSAAAAPRNYDDLLDTKWKSRMAWSAGSDASGALITITTLLRTWGEQKTDAYLVKLAKQDVTPLFVSNRQVADQIILGEYWIGIGISAHHPIISATRGAPSATILLEPVPSLIDAVQVVRGTKHPHAAMLFVDFILSAEAQRMMQAAEYFPSNVNVEPAASLRAVVPRNAGVSELLLTSEEIEATTPKSVELYKKYFR
jgi:iron(III) transport system substrate-binding protein